VPRESRLETEQLSKSILGRTLLDDVSIRLNQGEIHVLVGANGAGKSTLIRILSGADDGYTGTLRMKGQRTRFADPRAARRAGVHVIHQELSLIGPLSLTDHWLLLEERSALCWVSRRRARDAARRACERLGLNVDPDTAIEALSLSERQLVEIARALSDSLQVLILDEPSSALSEPEAKRLLDHVRQTRDGGAAVLYVSHRMEEIFALADVISVLRDGRLIFTRQASELTERELTHAMLDPAEHGPVSASPRSVATNPALPTSTPSALRELVLQDVSVTPGVEGLNLRTTPGEVIGVAGLTNSGAVQLLEALGGALPLRGRVTLNDAPMHFKSPSAALAAGFALVAADRKHSVLAELSVAHNGALSALGRFSRAGFVRAGLAHNQVARVARALRLRAPSLETEARFLSGGNQQKLALLRCHLTSPKVWLLIEPTRGVDVRAKIEIYSLINDMAATGVHVLFHSSELEELLALSSRIIVLHAGKHVLTLERAEFERARLLSAMMGAT